MDISGRGETVTRRGDVTTVFLRSNTGIFGGVQAGRAVDFSGRNQNLRLRGDVTTVPLCRYVSSFEVSAERAVEISGGA